MNFRRNTFFSLKNLLIIVNIFSVSSAFAEINLASGNYNHSNLDYQNIAEPELNVTRSYNSTNVSVMQGTIGSIAEGWSLSYFSEQLVVQKNHAYYTESWGPYAGQVDGTSYYQNTSTYPLSGHAIIKGVNGQNLALRDESGTSWKSLTDPKAIISCQSPVNINNQVVNHNRNPVPVGLYETKATYKECSSFNVKWNDGKEQQFGLKIGNVYKLTSVKLRSGWSATLSYDAAGRLLNVTSITGRQLNFQYNANGTLSQLIVPGNYTVNYNQSNGQLLSVSTSGGRTEAYQYQSPYLSGLLTQVNDVNSNPKKIIVYGIDGKAIRTEKPGSKEIEVVIYSGQVTQSLDKFGISTNYLFSYDNRHQLTSATRADGANNSFIYNDDGKLVSYSDANTNSTSYSYSPTGNQLTTTYANGLSATTDINTSLDKPTKITTPAAATTFTYDAKGNVLTKKITANAVTKTWTYTYDSLSRLTSVTDPIQGKTTYNYVNNVLSTIQNSLTQTWTINLTNAHGYPLKVTDPAGLITQYQYDGENRLTQLDRGGAITQYVYDDRDNLIGLIEPDSTSTQYGYNSADQLTNVIKSDGTSLEYVLDAAGRPLELKIFKNQTLESKVSYSYSAADGSVSIVTDGLGTSSQYQFDMVGNLISYTDALNRQTVFLYDAQNNVINKDQPIGGISLGYDLFDNPTNVSSPNGASTDYVYNGFDQITQMTNADTGTTQYAYSSKGLLSTKTDSKGNIATYTYDALGRVKTQAYTGGNTFTYVYDTARVGELTSIAGGGATLTYAYNSRGLVSGRTQTVGAVAKTVNYNWDLGNKLTSVTTPSGYNIQFEYAAGAQQPNAVKVNGNAIISNIAWAATRQMPLQWDWANGTTRQATIDANGQLTGVLSAGKLSRYLARDTVGNVLSIKPTANSSGGQLFTYDAMDRLISETLSTGQLRQYVYDLDGNRIEKNEGANLTTYDYDPFRLIGINTPTTSNVLALDANGSLLTDGARTFTYDKAGRLATAKRGTTTTTYKYNGLGQRYSKTGSVFVYDLAGHLIGEYTSAGVLIQEYVWLNDTPIAVLRAGTTNPTVFYIHSDELNTPRAITNANNALLWEWKSDAFGKGAANENPSSLGTFVFNLRFAGQYFDKESDLHYNYFRDYDPNTGRYIESDPIGLEGGINTFSYVENNSLKYVDTFGLQVDSPNVTLQSAIARGDVRQLEALMETLSPQYQTLAREAIQKFNSKAVDWIGKNCRGSVNQKFPGQFREKTLKEILDLAKTGDKEAKTAWKLLNDNRFKK